jgi:WD40 repeat protein
MRVFRDKTSLQLTPGLWPEIQRAIGQSEFFILLASPDAAASHWVQSEVSEWLQIRERGHERLLILLTDGDIAWDDEHHDFDWQRTTALPPNLKGVYPREPFYTDTRWARKSTDLSLRNPQFLDDIGTLAATLQGRSKDEMVGSDVREHRRFKSVATVAGLLLLVFAIGAGLAALYANRQRTVADEQRQIAVVAARNERAAAENEKNARGQAEERRAEADRQREIAEERRQEAERESRIATSREMAAHAVSQLSVDPELSLMLAIRAQELTHTSEAEDALRRSLAGSRVRYTFQSVTWMRGAEFSPDGRSVVIVRGRARVLEVGTWKTIAELADGDAKALLSMVSASFSTDGKWLVTTSSLGTPIGQPPALVTIWDTSSWTKTREFRGDVGGVPMAKFSGDGTRLVLWSGYQKAQVLDATTGRVLSEIDGQKFRVGEVAFSPGGDLLAVVGRDDGTNVARLLDTATGRVVNELGKEAWQNTVPVFSPSGEFLVVPFLSGGRVFEVVSGRVVGVVGSQGGLAHDFAFSPNGAWLAVGSSDHTATVWSTKSWQAQAQLTGHTGDVNAVAFSKDGRSLVTASRDGTARVWETERWRNVAVLTGHTQPLIDAAISPAADYVATFGQDSSARIWEVGPANGRVEIVGSAGIENGSAFPAAFSPDSRLVVTRGTSIDVWDPRTARKIVSLPGSAFLAFSPDGRSLFVEAADLSIHKFDVATWTRVAELRGHTKDILDLVFSPDGKLVATAGGYENSARVWNAETGASVAVLSGHTWRVVRVAFSPDGRHLATSSYDKTVRLWDVATWQEVGILRGHTAEVWTVSFSPDGRQILTASYDGTISLWDVSTKDRARQLIGERSYLSYAAFNLDGSRIVSSGLGQAARLWDAATGAVIASWRPPTDGGAHVAFSRDGTLAVAVAGTAAHIWDARSGQTVADLQIVPPGAGKSGSPTRALTGVGMSPDGRWLLAACNDGVTRLVARELFAPLDELLALAATRVTRKLRPDELERYVRQAR